MRGSARAIARAVQRGETEPDASLRAALDRVAADDAGEAPTHAFLTVAAAGEEGHAEAAATAEPSAEGRAPPAGRPLAGVPVAVKDNICTLGLPTSCGSKLLEGYRSPYEATVVRRLRAAGARVVGKTNMDEFAMGSSTENSAYGPTRNPRNRGRVPGGSSGGSAAAVAAGFVPCALGTDTGGSVRQPAALCGVVGIKPTYGRLSRYGVVAFASSLDQVGTFGRSVDDAALLLEAVTGHDPRDATSSRRPVPLLGLSEAGESDPGRAAPEKGRGAAAGTAGAGALTGVTIGVPEEYFSEALAPEVEARCREALELLRAEGAATRAVSLPHTRYAVPTYYILAPAEASSNLARFDGVRYGRRAPGADATLAVYEETRTRGFGPEVTRRIMLGTYALSAGYYEAYYGRAQKVRALIGREFRALWADGVDLLFTPTSPTPAFPLGERTTDPLSMYLSDIYTVTANLAGIPALSLPIGRAEGLPVGGQLLAPAWDEAEMVRVARILEGALARAGVWRPEEADR